AISASGTATELRATLDGARYVSPPDWNAAARGFDRVNARVRAQNATGLAIGGADAAAHINVTAVDDPPIITGPSAVTATEDRPVAVTGVRVSDVDADETPGVVVEVFVNAAHGNVVIDASVPGLYVVETNSSHIRFQAALLAANAALAGLIYTGAKDWSGRDELLVS
ncbi:unnamed protein product, partial [Phaeothamnion confervicola]